MQLEVMKLYFYCSNIGLFVVVSVLFVVVKEFG